MSRKAFLIILDGWGHGQDDKVSAIAQANTPFVDSLYKNHSNAELVTFGDEVGLPDGQMGNSEVGHLNLGAGRIVYQELARINKAVQEKTLQNNPTIVEAIAKAKASNNEMHLMGLLSDGGVHSHINHIIALASYFSDAGVKVFIHAFLDGRDTGPQSGKGYLASLLDGIENTSAQLISIVGRYYAMDRDNRWDRIAKAYNLLVNGAGELSNDPLGVVQSYYDKGINDEFMEPIWLGKEEGRITDGSTVLFANFRTDRPRQLTIALTQKELEHGMKPLSLHFVTMTEYDKTFKNVRPVFTKDMIKETLGEVVSGHGLSQLRIAETEKYPHVTFFFSGGQEIAYPGEERIMVNSPKVATYDLQPEMNAYELTNKVHKHIEEKHPDLIIMNYANADMVGHTGIMEAAITSVEALDSCLEALIPIAEKAAYNIVIIADHGNSDVMVTETGKPHTAHTVNMVPIIVIPQSGQVKVKSGKLADVAPTILALMDLKQPLSMTGSALFDRISEGKQAT